jgi:hypothetical protein
MPRPLLLAPVFTEERRFSSALEGGGIGGVLVTDSAGQKLAYVYFEDEPGGAYGQELPRFGGAIHARPTRSARINAAANCQLPASAMIGTSLGGCCASGYLQWLSILVGEHDRDDSFGD